MSTTVSPAREPPFNGTELTMLAHLYRGEMFGAVIVDCYRSKVWRTRLDATTNWAVATTGIALSVAFSNAENSPLPRSGGAVGSGVFTRSRNRTPLDALQKREPFIVNRAISTVV